MFRPRSRSYLSNWNIMLYRPSTGNIVGHPLSLITFSISLAVLHKLGRLHLLTVRRKATRLKRPLRGTNTCGGQALILSSTQFSHCVNCWAKAHARLGQSVPPFIRIVGNKYLIVYWTVRRHPVLNLCPEQAVRCFVYIHSLKSG